MQVELRQQSCLPCAHRRAAPSWTPRRPRSSSISSSPQLHTTTRSPILLSPAASSSQVWCVSGCVRPMSCGSMWRLPAAPPACVCFRTRPRCTQMMGKHTHGVRVHVCARRNGRLSRMLLTALSRSNSLKRACRAHHSSRPTPVAQQSVQPWRRGGGSGRGGCADGIMGG